MKSRFVKIYRNAISSEVCDEIIKEFDDSPHKHVGVTMIGYLPDVKKVTELHLTPKLKDENPKWKELDEKIFKAFTEALAKYAEDIPGGLDYISGDIEDTGYAIKCYQPNDHDEYKSHADTSSLSTCHRFLTGILYLKSVKEGGETFFKFWDQPIKPVKGTIAFFPSGFEYVHGGSKPKSGPKYIINTFFCYKYRDDEKFNAPPPHPSKTEPNQS